MTRDDEAWVSQLREAMGHMASAGANPKLSQIANEWFLRDLKALTDRQIDELRRLYNSASR